MTDNRRPLEADGRTIKSRERYMDLFLEEEIMCDPAFAEWFGRHLGITGAKAVDAEASLRCGDGETDLVVILEDRSGVRHLVHVENKVDSSFQKSQAERYRPRTRAHAAALGIGSSVTCLVAPARYGNRFIAQSTMDHVITYEAIMARIGETSGPRTAYRLRKIAGAVDNATYPVLANLSDEERRMRRVEMALKAQRGRGAVAAKRAERMPVNLELGLDEAA
jgi:hypothetical protein